MFFEVNIECSFEEYKLSRYKKEVKNDVGSKASLNKLWSTTVQGHEVK